MTRLAGVDETLLGELGIRATLAFIPENGPSIVRRFSHVSGLVVRARVEAMLQRVAKARTKGHAA